MPEDPELVATTERNLRMAIIAHAQAIDAVTSEHWLKDFGVVAFWTMDDGNPYRYTIQLSKGATSPHSAEGIFRAGARVAIDGDEDDDD